MPNTVIARVNTLGGNQPGQLNFTDLHGRLIGDVQIPGVPPEAPTALEQGNVNIEIPGVELEDNTKIPVVELEENVELPGVDGEDNETPQIFDINDDLDIPAQDPPQIDLEPATAAEIEI